MNAIEVFRVSKTFRIPHERHTTLIERLLNAFRPPVVERLRALDDVSLEIATGEFVGIIGANGSGKSTLLKLLAGVLVPDAGQVHVHGSLVPLLELGLGFHQELTVRENVALYGAVLGFPRGEMTRRIAEVIAFAELERFEDAKLKSLSSGMAMRLAFATALRADADILLFDEVLAVGDARFQQKCLEVFDDLKRRKKTIVFVSHDLAAVQKFCSRAFWLDKGKLVLSGDANQVVFGYLAVSRTIGLPTASPLESPEMAEHRFGDGRIRFARAQLQDETGRPVAHVRSGTRAVVRLDAEAKVATSEPTIGLIVHRGSEMVYSTNNALLGAPTGRLEAGDRIEIVIPLQMHLANGQYTITVGVSNTAEGVAHDWVNHVIGFIVEGSACGEGVADLSAEFRWQVSPGRRTGAASGT